MWLSSPAIHRPGLKIRMWHNPYRLVTMTVGFLVSKRKLTVIVIGLVLSLGLRQVAAQTITPPLDPRPPTPAPQPDGSTSDYLPEALRLIFPSVPASLDLTDTESPIFPADLPGFDLLNLGIIPDLTTSNPLTKTITLELGGGIRGRIFADPAWLYPLPSRFLNPQDRGKIQVQVSVRQDAGQGAGLLPAQTNWGQMRLSLNGALFDYAAPIIVGSAKIERKDSDRVFALHRQIASRLDSQGDLEAFIGSLAYPNASQLALGLVVDYLGENQYNQRLSETDFAGRVAETLAQKDYNGDGWLGFKPEDIVLGAPGWILGRKAV